MKINKNKRNNEIPVGMKRGVVLTLITYLIKHELYLYLQHVFLSAFCLKLLFVLSKGEYIYKITI